MVRRHTQKWDVIMDMSGISVRTEFPRQVREIENTWIPMPDGVKLAARIWLPEDAEMDSVPAILEYLPYRKRDGTVERDHLTHPYFAGHGYAGVRVDMRGTGDSEGVCLGEYLQQEQDDALAVIAWLANQPWCSGSVGMIGISWGGFNGLQVAALQPPALKAIITLCSTDDRYADDIHFMGGAVLTDKLAWGATAFAIANTPPDPAIVGEDRWRKMWVERLNANGLWMMDWFRHQRRDAFYEHGSICEDWSSLKTPVYAIGGWADGYTNPIFRMMEKLPGLKKALIGPWAHKYPHFATPGPRIGFLQECLRWWDQHLKGINTCIMDEPMIRAWVQEPIEPSAYHTTRPGRWVAETGWQGSAKLTLSFYPSGDALADEPGSEPILISSPENAGWTAPSWCQYGADPDGPLDQNGETGFMTTFESAPFKEDTDLLGFPIFCAEIECNQAQANIAAVLSLITPDGTATMVSFGVLNLTHRQSHLDPEPMTVGVAEAVSVQLNACGQRIPKGCRLRLALSSAYWPVIWPAQKKATLTLLPGTARLDLPIRQKSENDAELAPFPEPESAGPLRKETLSEGSYVRTRTIDYVTGSEIFERYSDTGSERHLHTDLTVRYTARETFEIHPDDPNSAMGRCSWTKSYSRGDWSALVEAEVSVKALADVWRIESLLKTSDAKGIVSERQWSEDIARDLV
ncbi:MAG: CocE/NonD family hydrolase [Pseudomonadota bacterium]